MKITTGVNLGKAVKYDDRPGHVTKEMQDRHGISEHRPSEGNQRFIDMVLGTNAKATCYIVDRDAAQKMANAQPFFASKSTLGTARDRGAWIVAVDTGVEATSSAFCGLIAAHVVEGSEVPRRRWPHNAYRAEN